LTPEYFILEAMHFLAVKKLLLQRGKFLTTGPTALSLGANPIKISLNIEGKMIVIYK
jgi:hypothetical protein